MEAVEARIKARMMPFIEWFTKVVPRYVPIRFYLLFSSKTKDSALAKLKMGI